LFLHLVFYQTIVLQGKILHVYLLQQIAAGRTKIKADLKSIAKAGPDPGRAKALRNS